MYWNGIGVQKDYQKALKWFRLSAEQEYSRGQKHLGWMYSKGDGVVQDYKEALKWFRRSAKQENANAQALMGEMYQYGKGVPQDYEEAVRWFRLSAENKNHEVPHGAYMLGRFYEMGIGGLAQDYNKAIKWYRIASQRGYTHALDDLIRLQSKEENKLTTKQSNDEKYSTNGLPEGWTKFERPNSAAEAGIDRKIFHTSPSSFYLKWKSGNGGNLYQQIKGYNGKRIRLSAMLKAKDIDMSDRGGQLWAYTYSSGKVVMMNTSAIYGTTQHWEKHVVVFDVPESDPSITYGLSLAQSGKLWIDSIEWEVVDKNTPLKNVVSSSKSQTSPVNLP